MAAYVEAAVAAADLTRDPDEVREEACDSVYPLSLKAASGRFDFANVKLFGWGDTGGSGLACVEHVELRLPTVEAVGGQLDWLSGQLESWEWLAAGWITAHARHLGDTSGAVRDGSVATRSQLLRAGD